MGTSNNSKGNKDKQKNPKMVHKYLAIAAMPHEYLHQLFTWVWKESPGRFPKTGVFTEMQVSSALVNLP